MATQMANGRWRARVFDAQRGRQVDAHTLTDCAKSFGTKRQAERAEDAAKDAIEAGAVLGVTLADWWKTWTTDPRWQRPKESTNIHNRERTAPFVSQYGHLPIVKVGDGEVAAWLASNTRDGQVPALRAMFNDAARPLAGRLVKVNPFAALGIERGPGRRDTPPPTPEQVQALVGAAWKLTPPSFASYLETAIWTGMRPGELDGLKWAEVDLDSEELHVRWQYNAKSRTFTRPKSRAGIRTIALLPRVVEVLRALPRDSDFVFTSLRGTHWTASSRSHHWNRVRCSVGLPQVDLYTATRHYCGWYLLNVVQHPPHQIALHLGHSDGGTLVTQLYGHPDAAIGRAQLRAAVAALDNELDKAA